MLHISVCSFIYSKLIFYYMQTYCYAPEIFKYIRQYHFLCEEELLGKKTSILIGS